ncbi:MAG: PLP-dependent aminotransferase family protein [Kiloniellales bacterium]|nr:PLP-dependent aminotransferase family protein [Kiloniellales bacterium]
MADVSHRKFGAALLPLSLEKAGKLPLQRQLFDQLREIILSGRVKPGERFPSTRSLAQELGCSRNTVIAAYDQLYAEGYLEGESGSGTYVSAILPEELLRPRLSDVPEPENRKGLPCPELSTLGARLAGLRRKQGTRESAAPARLVGLPETAFFPWDVWSRLFSRHWRNPKRELIHHGEPGGYPPLRRAIARYLAVARGLKCDWRQVIITSGAQQSIDLTLKALTDPGQSCWIEDPGYTGLRGPILSSGLEMVPVPVDEEGFSLEVAVQRGEASIAIITPSHHYPLGVVMSLPRRLQLLEWAREKGSFLLEDDYDSEYRYKGRPLTALQSLDRSGSVIYAGSFSKVLFPSLRLGYLVVPESLADTMIDVRHALDDHPSSLAQPVLADFFEEGHFAAHLRRTRFLYQERQEALIESAKMHLEDLLVVAEDEAGMHLLADLSPSLRKRMNDAEASRRAAEAGIAAPALSSYYLRKPARQALLLGYAALDAGDVETMVRRLAASLIRV